MNKRIRELALQAGGGLSCIAEPLEHPWKFSELELTKFAELIVRECADIVTDAVDHREPASTYVEKIKEHFGVE